MSGSSADRRKLFFLQMVALGVGWMVGCANTAEVVPQAGSSSEVSTTAQLQISTPSIVSLPAGPAVQLERIGQIVRFPGDLGAVAVAEGMLAISASENPAGVRLFDTTTGAARGELQAPTAGLNNLVFSLDHRRIAAVMPDGLAVIGWNLPAPTPAFTFPWRQKITSLAFHPNGQLVAIGDEGGRLALVDVQSGREVRTIPTEMVIRKLISGQKGEIRGIQFSPSGRYLAAVGGTILVMLVDLAQDRKITMQVIEGLRFEQTTFSPDERYLLATGYNMSMSLKFVGGKVETSVERLAGGLCLWDIGRDKSAVLRAERILFEGAFFSASGNEIVLFASELPFDEGFSKRAFVYGRDAVAAKDLSRPVAVYDLGRGPAGAPAALVRYSGIAWQKSKTQLAAYRLPVVGGVPGPAWPVPSPPALVAVAAPAQAPTGDFVLTDARLRGEGFPGHCPVDIRLTATARGYRVSGTTLRAAGKDGIIKNWVFCPGARHTWEGNSVDIEEGAIRALDSDSTDPLVFEVRRSQGYAYVRGKGTLVLRDGSRVSLPPGRGMAPDKGQSGSAAPETTGAAAGGASPQPKPGAESSKPSGTSKRPCKPKKPGDVCVDSPTMAAIAAMGQDKIFFVRARGGLKSLAELKSSDEVGIWGIELMDPVKGVLRNAGVPISGITLQGDAHFPALFQESPELKLFVTHRFNDHREMAIQKSGGGVPANFVDR